MGIVFVEVLVFSCTPFFCFAPDLHCHFICVLQHLNDQLKTQKSLCFMTVVISVDFIGIGNKCIRIWPSF